LNFTVSQGIQTLTPLAVMHRSAAAAEKIAKCMQTEHARLSAQRASLTPKLQFCHQKVHDCQYDRGMLNHGSEEGDAGLHGRSVPQASTINGSQINLTELDSKPQLVSWAHNVNFGAKPVQDMQNAGAQQVSMLFRLSYTCLGCLYNMHDLILLGDDHTFRGNIKLKI
jgi:hypothetical protein